MSPTPTENPQKWAQLALPVEFSREYKGNMFPVGCTICKGRLCNKDERRNTSQEGGGRGCAICEGTKERQGNEFPQTRGVESKASETAPTRHTDITLHGPGQALVGECQTRLQRSHIHSTLGKTSLTREDIIPSP